MNDLKKMSPINETQNNTQPGTNEDLINSLNQIGIPQIGVVKFSNNKGAFVTPDNGGTDVYIKKSEVNLNEGDEVEFIIIKDRNEAILKSKIA